MSLSTLVQTAINNRQGKHIYLAYACLCAATSPKAVQNAEV